MNETVYICKKEREELAEIARHIIKEKQKEELHQYDNKKEEERWLTGLMGERAVEVLTGLSIIDKTAGPSERYGHPDLEKAGYNIGIKTIKKENAYPLIPRHNTTAQIICVRDGNFVTVKGIASPSQLNQHQNDDLVYDYRIRGRKTCFTGMEYLTDMKYLDMYKIAE